MLKINEEFVAISKANFVLSLEFLNYNQAILNQLQTRCRILRNQIVHHEDAEGEQSHLIRRLNKTLKQFKKFERQKSLVAKIKPDHIDNRNGRHYQIQYFEYNRK